MILLAEVVWVMALQLRMEMSDLGVVERRRRHSLTGIVGSAMRLIEVKPRRLLGVKAVRLRRVGMECPAHVLEILARQRMTPGLFQTVMLLAQLLELLPAELLGVVHGR